MEFCVHYVGNSCIRPACPYYNACLNLDFDISYPCGSCSLYRGCEDCLFRNTPLCDKTK